jgi:oligoribonuclease NrnB/cAMP/cGMP phosphodiesterase (DHH superfamily)
MDGIFSAFAAHLRFKNWPNTKVTFVPHCTFISLNLEEKKEIFNENTEVYLLDYSGPRGFIPKLAGIVKKVFLIDHHLTAQNYLTEFKNSNLVIPNCYFNFFFYFLFLFLFYKIFY